MWIVEKRKHSALPYGINYLFKHKTEEVDRKKLWSKQALRWDGVMSSVMLAHRLLKLLELLLCIHVTSG